MFTPINTSYEKEEEKMSPPPLRKDAASDHAQEASASTAGPSTHPHSPSSTNPGPSQHAAPGSNLTILPVNLNRWTLDSGAPYHACFDKAEFLANVLPWSDEIPLPDGSALPVEGMGDVWLTRGTKTSVFLSNVFYVPKLRRNVVSTSLLRESGCEIREKGKMAFIYNAKGKTVAEAHERYSHLRLCLDPKPRDFATAFLQRNWVAMDIDELLRQLFDAYDSANQAVFQHISQCTNLPVKQLASENTADTLPMICAPSKNWHVGYYLSKYQVPYDARDLEHLVTAYEAAFHLALSKPGAVSMLRYLKSLGKIVVFVADDPYSARVRLIKRLSLSEHIDGLRTPDIASVPKLYQTSRDFLNHMGINVTDVVYVARDGSNIMQSATTAGALTVRVSNARTPSRRIEAVAVESLEKLEEMLRGKAQV